MFLEYFKLFVNTFVFCAKKNPEEHCQMRLLGIVCIKFVWSKLLFSQRKEPKILKVDHPRLPNKHNGKK
jgi:hypothetical protein